MSIIDFGFTRRSLIMDNLESRGSLWASDSIATWFSCWIADRAQRPHPAFKLLMQTRRYQHSDCGELNTHNQIQRNWFRHTNIFLQQYLKVRELAMLEKRHQLGAAARFRRKPLPVLVLCHGTRLWALGTMKLAQKETLYPVK